MPKPRRVKSLRLRRWHLPRRFKHHGCESDRESTERCQDCQREKQSGSRIIIIIGKRRNRVFIVQLFHCRFWRCRQHHISKRFLLCGEEVTIYEDGKEVRTEPASSRKVVDFGKGVGKREIFLYNLPEVESTHKIFDVPTVKARFGTSPGIWNTAMVGMARLLPSDILENKELMQQGASALMPLVKLVDAAVGEKIV